MTFRRAFIIFENVSRSHQLHADGTKIQPDLSHNRCSNKWDCTWELNSTRQKLPSHYRSCGSTFSPVSWILLYQAWKVSSFALLIFSVFLFIFQGILVTTLCAGSCVQGLITPLRSDHFYGWLHCSSIIPFTTLLFYEKPGG